MAEIDTRDEWLARALDEGSRHIQAPPWSPDHGSKPARRGLLVGVVASVVALALAAGIAAWLRTDEPSPRVGVSGPQRSWSVVPVAGFPLAPRVGVALVATDRGLLVWGGGDHDVSAAARASGSGTTYSDGAIYDPASKVWSTIPPAPLSGVDGRAGAVVAGTHVVVWRGYEIASLDLQTVTWSAHSTFETAIVSAVSTGSDVVVLGPNVVLDEMLVEQGDIPALPEEFEGSATAHSVAGRLIVVGRTPSTAGASRAVVLERNGGTWSNIADAGFSNQYVASATMGNKVAVVLATPETVVLRSFDAATGQWAAADNVPIVEDAIWLPNIATSTDTLMLNRQDGIYLRDEQGWLPPLTDTRLPTITSTVSLGDAFYVLGMSEGDSTESILELRPSS